MISIEQRLKWEIDPKVIDDGIGPYEYWGSKGVDIAWALELEKDIATIDVSDIPYEDVIDYLLFTVEKEHKEDQFLETTIKAELDSIFYNHGKVWAIYNLEQR